MPDTPPEAIIGNTDGLRQRGGRRQHSPRQESHRERCRCRVIAATPASSNAAELDRRDSDVSAQPWAAILPPLASMPTTIHPGKACAALRTNCGSVAATVPKITRFMPAASQPSIALMSRMPPPSWMGSDTAARIARIASVFAERPSKAPSRSTQCSHLNPAAANSRACAAGSSLKTTARFHLAALQTNAMAVFQVDGGKDNHGFHSRKLPRI